VRQVSFTLLMTRRCDSNPAQYERNRRFGHLVHVLGRSAGGAKLPSVGLCLNASKAESRLGMATILLGHRFAWGRIVFTDSIPIQGTWQAAGSAVCSPDDSLGRVVGPKSSVDDLCTGRVSYLVEQLPHCDLLRLSPLTG
jgi:hypothetical protein